VLLRSSLADWRATLVCRSALPRQPFQRMSRKGLTLLEVMVALVILSLVATGFLEIFTGALRTSAETRTWAQALLYAEEGQERVGRESRARLLNSEEALGGGFTRRTAIHPWREGVSRATVTVTLPDGERFELHRLVPVQ
jgi:prepilin-type N-terminal cleavage/methylation domain-containing protein